MKGLCPVLNININMNNNIMHVTIHSVSPSVPEIECIDAMGGGGGGGYIFKNYV